MVTKIFKAFIKQPRDRKKRREKPRRKRKTGREIQRKREGVRGRDVEVKRGAGSDQKSGWEFFRSL